VTLKVILTEQLILSFKSSENQTDFYFKQEHIILTLN
jgi:hypothetical protein